MSSSTTRRDFLVRSALSLAAVPRTLTSDAASTNAAILPGNKKVDPPTATETGGKVAIWITDRQRRYAPLEPLDWNSSPGKPENPRPGDTIVLAPARKFQDVLGFGGCFSDAACWVLSKLRQPTRANLFHELFDPSEMGFNVCRMSIGAADSAATVYSFDEGPPDPELARFSIDHDRAYIIPVMKEALAVNPEIFYFGSPWSPPGWMKWNGSMLGGAMMRQYLAPYAKYFLKYIQQYRDAGVPIRAITVQNEIDTDQHGLMPACIWSQECENEFVIDHLGPLFQATGTQTEIWTLDHNFELWGRPASQFGNAEFRQYVKGIAWHPYRGDPSMISRVHNEFPDVKMYFTEGSTDYNDPHYLDDWNVWSATYTDVLRNWCRCVTAWNMATDQNGRPNIGPYACGGMMIINPDTQEVIRSGQYWTFAHYSRHVRRGARRFDSQSASTDMKHVAFENPDGKKVLVLTNTGAKRTVDVQSDGNSLRVPLEENALATLVWD